MILRSCIEVWDGKSADDIRALYQRTHQAGGFLSQIIELIPEPVCELGASWLLKAWLEDDHQLTAKESYQVLSALPGLHAWEAKLHILQCFEYFQIPASLLPEIETFLRMHLDANNKFVRAWCYHGFYHLARQYPDFQQEVSELMDMAMRDEPASVKARVRNLLKLGW